jgi:hypothetical protein
MANEERMVGRQRTKHPDPIAIVEAGYDLDASDEQWLSHPGAPA